MAADDKMERDAPAAAPTTYTPTLDDLKKNITLLEKAVQSSELRLINRVIRNNAPFRRALPPPTLAEALHHYLAPDLPLRALGLEILSQLPCEASAAAAPPSLPSPSSSTMDVDKPEEEKPAGSKTVSFPSSPPPPPLFLPETTTYLLLLVLTSCLRASRHDLALSLASALLPFLRSQNRRTLDPLAAKAIFYLALTQEKSGKPLAALRPLLVALHRTACLRHDDVGQATILNLLLRGLLADNLIEQASNLAARTHFPEGASNNQLCRYLYYVGCIQATQLDYSDAFTKLNQAARKAPSDDATTSTTSSSSSGNSSGSSSSSSSSVAVGFRRAVTKLLLIVQLLLGEIPERATFDQPSLRRSLLPYLALTAAVRHGDLLEFEKTVQLHAKLFKKDKTYTLILRLGHNVIKTGLRKISLSYSRISLIEIAQRLHLDGPLSAEFVCAKAIRDGVIDALIDHEAGFLQSRDTCDVYSTTEPQQAFHKRITFCLDVHNEAVKSLRYPDVPSYGGKTKGNLDEEEEGKEKKGEEEKTEEELAKELEEDMEEEY